MEINQVLRVGLESLQVEQADVSLGLFLGDLVNRIQVLMIAVVSCRSGHLNTRVNKLKGKGARESAELETQKVQQALAEVNGVSSSPRLLYFGAFFCVLLNLLWKLNSMILLIDRSDHQASMLTSQLVSCLSQVQWDKLILPPEIEQLLRDTK